ncbi:heparinase II/III family protein [Paenibacillus oryzisoli]|uniref:heparinase II/III domain-containing protein n=1 Tax=Paenibacillus oryzisoli TaxID=1850517 RepID=UPI003D2D59B0
MAEKPEWRKCLRAEHPRLMATPEDFAAVKIKINTDPRAKQWYEAMKQQALDELDAPRKDDIAETTLGRMTLLAFMFKIDGNPIFAEYAYRELCEVSELPTWRPDFFLHTSAFMMSCAIGYDWLYETLTVEQRQAILSAIIEKGLQPAREIYRHTPNGPYGQSDWPRRTNNWNLVCNGGVIMGALAVGEEAPMLVDEVLEGALRSMPVALASFEKDGGWNEGVAYWIYTWVMLSRPFAALDSALGSDFNELAHSEGIRESGYFPIYMEGPTGLYFNFADCFTELNKRDNEGLAWLATKFDLPVLTKWRVGIIDQGGQSLKNPLDLLWYRPDHMAEVPNLPLDKHYRGIEVATMRSAWQDPEAVFIGFKAGDNQAPHGELDMGTFVVDALGERWIMDNGEGNRRWPDFWDMGTNGKRWTYYKKRAEGHNTLVINPRPQHGDADANPDQDPLAKGAIAQFQASATECYATMDLTAAYAQAADKVLREIALVDNRQHIRIHDEIALKEAGDILWFLHINSQASVKLSEAGRMVTLTIGDKSLQIQLTCAEEEAAFTVMEAKPLPTSPDPEVQWSYPQWENPRYQETHQPVQKLSIWLSNKQQVSLTILMIPLKN